MLTASGLIGILCHAPIGAFIDATHHKRSLLVASVALLAVCAITIARWPIGPVVFAADATMAALGGVFTPAMGALSLGFFPRWQFAARLARNTVFDRAGNIFIAALIGFVGWIISQRAIFYLLPLFALLAAAAVLAIPASAIDDRKARGFALRGEGDHPEGWWDFFTKHPSHFPAVSGTMVTKPVRLPPGRAKFATKPLPIGSARAFMYWGPLENSSSVLMRFATPMAADLSPSHQPGGRVDVDPPSSRSKIIPPRN